MNLITRSFLVVGGGGREASFAMNLAADLQRVHAVMPHENPSIIDCVRKTGGSYAIGDPGDPGAVLEFARAHSVDYSFVNADEPLANGVVDSLVGGGLRAVGGTRAATRVEWDKVYAMKMMDAICPEHTPFYRIVSGAGRQLDGAMSEFKSRGMQVVVKPQGLTGGKGVKVMPEHLPTYDDCLAYASELLDARPGESVLLVERLEGMEFTIMGITDGEHLVMAPATYDYPFRLDGDRGPGTGGMGCFSGPGMRLPFMSRADEAACRSIMQRVIDHMRSRSLGFTGVLNGGFFKTRNGIRFMEFNSRFGDPECLNVISVLRTPLSEVLVRMWGGDVSDGSISFARMASVNKYLVAGEYPSASPDAIDFEVDDDSLKRLGVKAYYASCVRTGANRYRTLKKSRVVALSAVSDTVQRASDAVNRAIESCVRGDLDYRRDIGSTESLGALERRAGALGLD